MQPEPTARIIFGQPQSVDAFPGGGHARSARALSESIGQIFENGETSGHHGGAIGLEGGWGAGKSSVIEMAAKHLPADYHIVSFDMWSHQTDNFKRAFLEDLISHVEASIEKWPSGIGIDREREIVQSRRRHVTDATKKSYTPVGAALLLLLPFVAIIFAWLQPSAVGNPNLSSQTSWALWGGVTVIAASAILLGWLFFRTDTSKRSGFWAKASAKFTGSISEFLTLSRDVNSQTTTQEIREEDPTTAEFSRIFHSLLGRLQVGGRKIIFVLDNVDRLPKEQVKAAWSEMRSLFATRTRRAEHTVLAIVPYDRPHIADAFGLAEGAANGAANGVQGDIFEKTFDRIIKVAPPVPSDWRGYLDTQLGKALLPPPSPAESEKLFRLFKHYLVTKKLRVTPRRIISYVNEVGSLRVQWGGRIPLEAMALYALNRHEVDGADSVIKAMEDIPRGLVGITDLPDWQRFVAALTFNVEPEHANQVLFEPIIAGGLVSHVHTDLHTASKSPGFWEVFLDVVESSAQDWAASGPETLALVAKNLEQLKAPQHRAAIAWRTVAKALDDATFTIESIEQIEALAAIVANQPGTSATDVAERIEAKFLALAPEASNASRSLGFAWATAVAHVGIAVRSALGEAAEAAHIAALTLPDDPDFIIGVAERSFQSGDFDFSRLELEIDFERMSQSMLALLESDVDAYVDTQEVIAAISGYDIDPHLAAVTAHLQAGTSDAGRLLRSAAIYSRIDFEAAKRHLKPLWRDGTLAWYAFDGETHGNAEDAATAIYLGLVVEAGPIPSNRSFNAQLTDVASCVAWYNELFAGGEISPASITELATTVTEMFGFQSLAAASLANPAAFSKVMVEAAQSRQVVSVSQILGGYGGLTSTLGAEAAAALVRDAIFVSEELLVAEIDNIEPRVGSNEFLAAAELVADTAIGRQFFKKVDERLSGFDTEAWITTLTTPGDEDLRLLIGRIKSGHGGIKGAHLVDALAEVATKTLEGTFDPAIMGTDFPLAEKALSRPALGQSALAVAARLSAIGTTLRTVSAFLSGFPKLADALRYDTDAATANAVLDRVVWFLLADAGTGSDEYLVGNASKIRSALKLAGDDTVERIDQALKDVLAVDEERGARLQSLVMGRQSKSKAPKQG